MSILFIASFLTMFFLGMPALTSAYARQLGRNARLWFFIGLLLPGIATLLLSILPDLSTSRPKVVQDGNESNQIDGPFVS